MGQIPFKEQDISRRFDLEEVQLGILAFKGDLVEEKGEKQVEKKNFLSSKLLRKLYGDVFLSCFEAQPGEFISSEQFICTLALCYKGNTEDKIGYIFTMYSMLYGLEKKGDNGWISENDFCLLLNYTGNDQPLPKPLLNAFPECGITAHSEEQYLSTSSFLKWVRKYPQTMKFLADCLPPTTLETPSNHPKELWISTKFNLQGRDALNRSPSFRDEQQSNSYNTNCTSNPVSQPSTDTTRQNSCLANVPLRQTLGSFDFSDESDSSATSSPTAGHDIKQDPFELEDTEHIISNEDNVEQDRSEECFCDVNTSEVGNKHKQNALSHSSTDTNIYSQPQNLSNSRIFYINNDKKRKNSKNSNNSTMTAEKEEEEKGHVDVDRTARFVCGYLDKVSDGKLYKKGWHRRWFVLDRSVRILYYFKAKPTNFLLLFSPKSNHLQHFNSSYDSNKDEAQDEEEILVESILQHDVGREEDAEGAVITPGIKNKTYGGLQKRKSKWLPRKTSATSVSQHQQHFKELEDDSLPTQTAPLSAPASVPIPAQEPTLPLHNHSCSHSKVCIEVDKSHSWFRGSMDLDHPDASLLFEKQYAKNAPTTFFFQVSTLSIGQVESRRGTQFKLCASSDTEFDLWTNAIVEVINQKHIDMAMKPTASIATATKAYDPIALIPSTAAPSSTPTPLSHQQIYRRQLLQKQQAEEQEKRKKEELDKQSQLEQQQQPNVDVENRVQRQQHQETVLKWAFNCQIEGAPKILMLFLVCNILALRCFAQDGVYIKLMAMGCVSLGFMRFLIMKGNPILSPNSAPKCQFGEWCCLHPRGSSCSTLEGENIDSNLRKAKSISFSSNSPSLGKFDFGSTCSLHNSSGDDQPNQWAYSDGRNFMVRSKGYKRGNRVKEPSVDSLFEFEGMDLVESNWKIDNIMTQIRLPEHLQNEKLFVINAQFPAYSPCLPFWNKNQTYDGPSYSVVMYWTIPKELYTEIMSNDAGDAGVTSNLGLLARFLKCEDEDIDVQNRFKVIAQVMNPNEVENLNSASRKLMMSHNATPLLTRPQHRIYNRLESNNYFEIDVDVHIFSYIARKGIDSLLDKTTSMVVDMGFLLQAESDSELPERILGSCSCRYIDFSQIKHLDHILS